MGSGERYEKTQYGGAPHRRRGRRCSPLVDAASYDVYYLTIIAPAPKGNL